MAANPLAFTPRAFNLHVETSDGIARLRCEGQLIGDWAEHLTSELATLSRQYKRIRIDLSELRRIDSSGLGALIASYLAARNAGCDVCLVNPSHRVKALLETTHLASVLSTHEE